MQEAQVWKEEAGAEKDEAAAAKSYMEAGLAGIQIATAVAGPGYGQMPQPPMQQPGAPPLQ